MDYAAGQDKKRNQLRYKPAETVLGKVAQANTSAFKRRRRRQKMQKASRRANR